MQKPAPDGTVRVWDLPTRLFHWFFAGLLCFSFATGKLGPIEWHLISGKFVLSLLLFRLAWGFVGGEYARFASFLAGPRACIAYCAGLLRGGAQHHLGHNPLGGWSIVAMLLLVAVQGGTGLFATDDIYTDGPLKYLVSDAASKRLTTIHAYSINVLLFVVALHVLAALYYLVVRKDNLILPMITGDKTMKSADAHLPGTQAAPAWLAPLLVALALALVFGGLRWFGK